MESSGSGTSAVTATAETSDEIFIGIKAEVKKLIPDSVRHSYLKEIDFELAAVMTREMKLLLDGVTEPLRLNEEIGEEDLSILRLGELAGKEFLHSLEFPKESKVVYFRHFYEKLYQVLLKHWSSYKRAVILTGNAGTGKSWFQAYALRRLAQDGTSTYRFVVRQVADTYFLHDLSTHNVYQMTYDYNSDFALENVVNGMTETLHFYEPRDDMNLPPKYFTIPSLSTLSPNQKRIKEYIKHCTVQKLYFPVWSKSEYAAVGLNQGIDQDEIEDRYYKCGGILRHLFHDKSILQGELESHLGTDRLTKFLRSEVFGVDAETGNGNASGYLVCYTDIPFDGDRAFKSRKLMLTSSYVREKTRENINLVSEVDIR
jgi:hypothetical protein